MTAERQSAQFPAPVSPAPAVVSLTVAINVDAAADSVGFGAPYPGVDPPFDIVDAKVETAAVSVSSL